MCAEINLNLNSRELPTTFKCLEKLYKLNNGLHVSMASNGSLFETRVCEESLKLCIPIFYC